MVAGAVVAETLRLLRRGGHAILQHKMRGGSYHLGEETLLASYPKPPRHG